MTCSSVFLYPVTGKLFADIRQVPGGIQVSRQKHIVWFSYGRAWGSPVVVKRKYIRSVR